MESMRCTYEKVLYKIGRNVSERQRCRKRTRHPSGRCTTHLRAGAVMWEVVDNTDLKIGLVVTQTREVIERPTTRYGNLRAAREAADAANERLARERGLIP